MAGAIESGVGTKPALCSKRQDAVKKSTCEEARRLVLRVSEKRNSQRDCFISVEFY